MHGKAIAYTRIDRPRKFGDLGVKKDWKFGAESNVRQPGAVRPTGGGGHFMGLKFCSQQRRVTNAVALAYTARAVLILGAFIAFLLLSKVYPFFS